MDAQELAGKLQQGDQRALARAISLAENDHPTGLEILQLLRYRDDVPVVGITGPPGAGKSSLVNSLAERWLEAGLRVAVIAVDPTSPFNFGSLLGDRLRMAGLYLHPNLFIRSMASRGSLGGLSPRILEVCDLIKNAGYDRIVIETVGVGQSEVEIAGVADTTVVVMVPEAGDEVQTMKSGVMEIADVFVVNKADREGAESFARLLRQLSIQRHTAAWEIPVLLTRGDTGDGVDALGEAIIRHHGNHSARRKELLFEKALHLLREQWLRRFPNAALRAELETEAAKPDFNLYRFVANLAQRG